MLDVPGNLAFAVHRQRVLCLRDGRPGAEVAAVITAVSESHQLSRFTRQVLSDLIESSIAGRCAWPAPQIRALLDILRVQPINRYARYRLEVQDAQFSQRQGERMRAIQRLLTERSVDRP